MDFDDMHKIPAIFKAQLDEAIRARMPDMASRSDSRPPIAPIQNTTSRTVVSENASEFATWRGDNQDEDDSDICCDDSRKGDVEYHFCWPCDTVYCDHCWPRPRPHRKRAQPIGGLPHEQTDPFVAKKIKSALEADLTDREQAMLHIQDEDTSWFGAWKGEQDEMVFQDYGRYATLMAENSARERKVRYPALVSFVGQTGAGKSTLIRLLIELYSSTDTRLQVPVVGSTKHQDTPTSGDVHLYCDPKTSDGKHPVLYADCEGLDGGEREPMGAKSRNKSRKDAPSTDYQKKRFTPRNTRLGRNHSTSEREILWATTEQRRSRDYIVRNLYPRLLYTFSDVIVFVMKNPRVIEVVIEQLIRWAAAALETSSNQPVLPHAIIVLNASENATDPELWDVDKSTAALMQSVHKALLQNHTLKNFAQFWRQRKRSIQSIESLMLSYYSNVRVVRVPERGRPKLIFDQLQRLYVEIATACEQSRTSKQKVRMLLNSDDLQPYLQYAFDHFCRDLDFPFDFVQASFAHNPIPSDFGGNILKLAINVMEVWKDKLDGPKIFKELSYVVASCIMLDSARHRTLGPAEKVFPEYIEHCDDALDDFCDRHWPCEYMSIRGRCVNVKAGHNTKGHQLKSGQVLAVGDYQSSFAPQVYRAQFRDDIYAALAKLLEELQQATSDSSHLELEQAAHIHRDSVLKNFFNHLRGPKEFVSHTACFSCLVSIPEHPLPCGHVLCTPCVKAFGTPRGRTIIDMKYCPLHENDTKAYFGFSWPISLKPPGAGVRILSLDGGGVRAIVQLTILQQIERALGVELPIQAFFDLIVGTGTGGLIALALGNQARSLQNYIKIFEELCDSAFTKKKGIGVPGIDFFVSASNHSRYGSKPLEAALQSHYGEENLFGGLKHLPDAAPASDPSTKVAVTTTTTNGTVILLANYNRTSANGQASYQFYRSEKPRTEIKAWEAARATSAAPRIFKPFGHEASGQIFQDGGIYYNNPIELAVQEKKLIWPEVAETHADIVLSIGTGYNSGSSGQSISPGRIARWNKVSRAKRLAKVSIDQFQSTLNSEEAWRNFVNVSALPERLEGRYIRLNLPLAENPPKLDEVSSMADLQEMTRSSFTRRRDELKSIADRLIATSFYFELKPDTLVELDDDSIVLTGNILCRFPPGSKEIQKLGEAFRKHSTDAYNQQSADHDPYFVVLERRKEGEASKIVIGTDVVEKMIQHGQFFFGRVTFRLSDPRAETNISLCFADTSPLPIFYPISGFPKCLLEEQRKTQSKRRHAYILGRRRTPTTDHRRGTWMIPNQIDNSFNPIQRYRDPGYVFPGDATPDAISEISQRFSPTSSIVSPPPPPYLSSLPYVSPSSHHPPRIGVWPGRLLEATTFPQESGNVARPTRGDGFPSVPELMGSERYELE
jgi:patatin-like phospholipase/acyl hydrolase/energy-coupling factor transporter ATP-binding protein EcfA2